MGLTREAFGSHPGNLPLDHMFLVACPALSPGASGPAAADRTCPIVDVVSSSLAAGAGRSPLGGAFMVFT